MTTADPLLPPIGPPASPCGVMAARVRDYDWPASSLGPIARWPQSLRTAVRIMLSSRFAMWMAWGPDLTFFCNDAYLPTLGVKEAWALGSRSKTVWAEIWPDIGPRIQRVLATGEATWDEALPLFLERRGFTEETYHTFSYSPLADDAGAITGMLCVVSEETERVIGERRLTLLQHLGAGMAGARTVREVGSVIEACLSERNLDLPVALLDLFAEEESGHARLVRAGLPDDRAQFDPIAMRAMAHVRAGGRPDAPALSADLQSLLSATGSGPWDRPPRQMLALPVGQRGAGSPAAALLVGLNPYRPLDDAYQGFIDLFVGQVATGLANANAYEDERRRAEALAEIDRQKTVFFSNVSHEFRTPLTLMLGPLEEVLAKSPDHASDDDRALVQVAHRNGLRLLKLVNVLLDFSRIEAGRHDCVFRPTDLSSLTAELASSFRSSTEKAGIDLVVDCRPLTAPAFVDRGMWEKIVFNLLSNAFKFTLAGTIGVSLAETGDHVRLTVTDTGIGIPASELPRLFERFHRVAGAHGRSFEGSGIGLALVQELAKLHGGVVAAESEQGCGSAFSVTLPLGRGHLPGERVDLDTEAPPAAALAPSYVEEAARWLGDGVDGALGDAGADRRAGEGGETIGRVLVADDNADMRGYVRRLLEGRGYAVDAVTDGAEALASARSAPPDIILSDVMMPRLDGFQLLTAIRADPRLQAIPVVLLSARAGEEARIDGVSAGADDYLTKPFSARELMARVETNLKLARVRREGAEALRRMNETLEAQVAERTAERDQIWRLSSDLMAVCGFDGHMQSVNPAWTDLLGWTEGELVGSPFIDLIHPDDAERTTIEASRVRQGLKSLQFENRCRQRDGAFRTLSWTAVPAGDKIYAVGRDVTEQRALEDAFRQAQKMEAVGQLTGGVAHDFNNLLTVIKSSTDLLKRPDLSEERRGRYVDAISDTVARAAKLTGQLLAFARRQALKPVRFEAGRSLTAITDMVGTLTGSRIRVTVVTAESPCFIDADPSQFDTAIINMVVNARDAMNGEGELAIAVQPASAMPSASPPADGRRHIAITVSDTGSGIAPSDLQKIFDPFFTTKAVGQGTGLGLSQVFGFAKQSGGEIKVESVVGQGTTFTLYMPQADDGDAPTPDDEAPEPLVAGHGTRVLVVDDNSDVGSFAMQALAELGYRAVWVANVDAAFEEMADASRRFDVVFSDVVMPGTSGIDFAQALRRDHPDMPVVLTSGYSHVLAENGADGFELLQKPYSVEQLSRVLQKVAAAKRRQGSSNGR